LCRGFAVDGPMNAIGVVVGPKVIQLPSEVGRVPEERALKILARAMIYEFAPDRIAVDLCGALYLVFLAPDLHPVAVERNEILDAGDRIEGMLVAPRHVVRARVAHTERPVGGVSLVRSVAGMIGAA